MPTPVLATKLLPPPRRPIVVVRPRLVELLDTTLIQSHRLTLVSAPAGFGKTTLLSEWTAKVSSPHVRVGWVSLDERDSAATTFLAHLWAALVSTGPDLDLKLEGLDALAAVSGSRSGSSAAILTAVVNELVRAGTRRPNMHWLLVLDDYHVIQAPEVHEAVTFLLEHAPQQLHLLVATRSDPPLPLSRLRSRGQLMEVRAADLRFPPAEAKEFLNTVMGLHLTEIDVQALAERTEGWIAGLQLAALSLSGIREREGVADFIAAFTGSNRFVIDYLVDEVLARHGPDVRDFLLTTAPLDHMTGALCDALTGRADGGRALEDLDRRNVFLVPLDTERSWYRYHLLFRDALRARLTAERPESVPLLHRSASRWYEEQGSIGDAARHSLAAGDYDRAGYLVESAEPQLRRTRQDTLLQGWMQALPETVVRRSPVLSIMSGWSRLMAGDLDGMQHRLDDADAALAAGLLDENLRASWADTEDLRTAPATISVYRAALAQARGDTPATVRHAQRAWELTGDHDHFLRGAAAGFLGLSAWATGDVGKGLSTFSEAVRSLRAAGHLVDALDSTIVLGDMWVTAGAPSRARSLHQKSLATAMAHGEPYPRATADLHVSLADLDREQGDLTSAEAHLETARVLREVGSITENRHRWYVVMAQLRTDAGDYAMGRSLLDEAESLYRPGFYPDLRPIPAMKARLAIAAGDLGAAGDWARAYGDPQLGAVTFLHEYDDLTLVRLRLGEHQTGAAPATVGAPLQAMLALLDHREADTDPERTASLLEIGMLRALVQQQLGQQQLALGALSRALELAREPERYVRLFLDEGAPMLALLNDARRTASSEFELLRQHAQRLLAIHHTSVQAGTKIATAKRGASVAFGSLAEPLSDRELEVLRLLASELGGPEIARHLFVSLNTLRTHTRHIFTKLDVNSRPAAVRRGRDLGLL